MKKFLLFLGVALATTLSVSEASAQIKVGEGQVSVALESNNNYYAEDKVLEDIELIKPLERLFGDYGSNDYLKVDYNLNRFSAGVQVDGYLPPLYGYDLYNYLKDKNRDTGNKNFGFLSFYAQFEGQNWGVRVGDIYDQFGNGLVFRSYEDRALAFNNSILGARAYYNLGNFATLKAIAGKPRLYNERSENWVYGADLSVSLSDIFGWSNGLLSVEGSYVGRSDSNISEFDIEEFDPITWLPIGVSNILEDNEKLNMLSGRVNFEHSGFSFRGEYVAKLNDDLYNPDKSLAKGNVLFLDFGYNYKRFSASASFRRIENMTTFIDPRPVPIGGGNTINYIPLLTRQHTYSLANLNPYTGVATHTGGEVGGQIDLYYSLRNPKARGKYWNFHANFSMFNTLDHVDEYAKRNIDGRNGWIEANADVERQWNKKVKTTFLYAYQRWDQSLYKGDSDANEAHYYDSHIFVADATYKFNKKHSVRVEAQYLADDDFSGDWVAGTIEYNLAPKFSVYVSDMWNCEPMGSETSNNDYDNFYATNIDTGEGENFLLHYYQIGGSYTHNSLRVQLSYGRNRAGYVCSGGVCRFQPAYTGLNLAMTLSF